MESIYFIAVCMVLWFGPVFGLLLSSAQCRAVSFWHRHIDTWTPTSCLQVGMGLRGGYYGESWPPLTRGISCLAVKTKEKVKERRTLMVMASVFPSTQNVCSAPALQGWTSACWWEVVYKFLILPCLHVHICYFTTSTVFVLILEPCFLPSMQFIWKVMPPLYFHGNYNRYKKHNNIIW